MKRYNSPVYPISPSFDNDENLDVKTTSEYVKYLSNNGAKVIMTTAGTSQFNLMSTHEVRELNKLVYENFEGQKILGLQPLSLKDLLIEINELNDKELDVSNTAILILFPERYHNEKQVIEFFTEVCETSIYPVLVHGNILKRCKGGEYEYDKSLLSKLYDIKGFIGMKEEASNLMSSTVNLPKNMEVIVAGGSMKRFWALEPHGATTYLTGVGSFNPKIEEEFYESYMNGDFNNSKRIMDQYEKPLFEIFMSIGWHPSMRTALKYMGYINNDKRPFAKLSDLEITLIETALKIILK